MRCNSEDKCFLVRNFCTTDIAQVLDPSSLRRSTARRKRDPRVLWRNKMFKFEKERRKKEAGYTHRNRLCPCYWKEEWYVPGIF